jgi:hypothetical protein
VGFKVVQEMLQYNILFGRHSHWTLRIGAFPGSTVIAGVCTLLSRNALKQVKW